MNAPAKPAKLFLLGVLLLLTAYAYGDIVTNIARICWEVDDYSHGLLLPFLSAYIIFENRKKFFDLFATSTRTKSGLFVGISLLFLALILYIGGQVLRTMFLGWASLFPFLLGCLWLILGSKLAFELSPLVLLNFMAKPLPDSLIPRLFGPLQEFAAKVSALVLEALNVPVYLLGNVIEIPHMKLLVEEACSGMRSLMALITVSLILICYYDFKNISKLLILLLAIIVAIVLNVLRVAMTGVLAYFYDPDSASGFFHTFSGMVVFVVGLVILSTIAHYLPKVRKQTT